jgi:hypothetical protein
MSQFQPTPTCQELVNLDQQLVHNLQARDDEINAYTSLKRIGDAKKQITKTAFSIQEHRSSCVHCKPAHSL